jgi:hypothetical protein
MSTTYIAVLVMVLVQIFPSVTSVDLTTTATTIVTIASGLWIMYKRWKGNQAPIGVLGFKK